MRKKICVLITLLIIMTLAISVTALAAVTPVSVELPVTVNGTGVVELKAEEGTSDEFDGIAAIDGSGAFELRYDEPGLYEYKAWQIPGDSEAITYDETVYEVRVFVESDEEGVLTAAVITNAQGDTEKGDGLSFTNRDRIITCFIDPPIKKVVKSSTGAPSNSEFKFVMTPRKADDPMPQNNLTAQRDRSTGALTITVRGEGEYEFGEIAYGLEDLGKTYVYTIAEVDGSEAGYTYDSNKYTVRVEIVRDENFDLTANEQWFNSNGEQVEEIVFTNSYTKPATISVQTGISDYAGVVTACVAALLALAVALYIVITIKDKRGKSRND